MLVEREAPITEDRKERVRADIVGWAPDAGGELRPRTLVELSSPRGRKPGDDVVLAQLRRAGESLGTTEHYLFDGSSWWLADQEYSTLTSVGGPLRVDGQSARLADRDTLRRRLTNVLWENSDRSRDVRRLDLGLELSLLAQSLIESAGGPAAVLGFPPQVQIDRAALWEAIREVVAGNLWAGRGAGEYGMPPSLAPAMINLLQPRSGLLLDPFCGAGTLLWAARDFATQRGVSLTCAGIDVNSTVAGLARSLAALSGGDARIETEDALRSLPRAVNYVVSEPPMGLRLSVPVGTAIGPTVDGDVASIEKCLECLLPGGRAVLHLGRRWLAQGRQAADLRHWISDSFFVRALIGLPSGLFAGTGIPTCLAVVDATPTTQETLVADLADDWEAQLSLGGAFLDEYLATLER